MLSFQNDYQEGAHEKILKRLMETNLEPQSGYGSDSYTESAKEKIRKVCECPQADVWFLTGGTQTNQNVIDAMLQPYEGVVAASTGHVSVHEAGAIEFTGHKVLTIPQHEGKIYAEELESYLRGFWEDTDHEHMVFPGMVYISHPTEYGTLYTRSELENISAICEAYDIPLYLDGARLGYGLMSDNTDVTLGVISSCCDVFYIGGTKVGALCGEAVVFTKDNAPKHFLTHIKQHGALLAKGRLLGIQFDTLFTDSLYEKVGAPAIQAADQIRKTLKEQNFSLCFGSPTNQVFCIVDDALMTRLEKQVEFGFWEKYDDTHTVIRFATSWATTKEDVDALCNLLCNL